ncbi:uncharacterized protein TNCV_4124391 [Trichonephila clavipes]|nr:uncharacterized protein TNCV_4124391 [Trichonephila clavipes]
MLRALTSYFFGNIQDETPDVPVECETHEVNDWLVVNLPDQTENSINLDDETEVNNEEDLNEDDILLSISILMQSEGIIRRIVVCMRGCIRCEFSPKQCQIFDSSSELFFEFINRIKEIQPPVVIQDCSVTCVCAPKYPKAYVNHRPPTPTQSTDLIQRIKELEPEQKATRRIARKNLSRSQINRQNKNYIYENSSKKNRRKQFANGITLYNRTSY